MEADFPGGLMRLFHAADSPGIDDEPCPYLAECTG
jgi:hypothetical protein